MKNKMTSRIYKKDLDEVRLARYATIIKTGEDEQCQCSLPYLVHLALVGNKELLEQEIAAGAPVMGVNVEILEKMEDEVRLPHKRSIEYSYYCYTTVDAAVYAEQYEVLQMLLKKGAVFDLRNQRLREIFYQCRDRNILELALSKEEYHYTAMSYTDIFDEVNAEDVNLVLLDVLYEHGCRPTEDVIVNYWKKCGKYWMYPSSDRADEEDLVAKYFMNRGYHAEKMNVEDILPCL